jgi:hypothetical protein
MTMLCPCCLKQTEADLIDEPESLTIRDVQVIAQARYYRCRSCGGEWDHPDHDQMELAYRKYRRLKGWTQEEMDRQVGWRCGIRPGNLTKILAFFHASIVLQLLVWYGFHRLL